MQIALISDHASPLAVLGGTDSGGQNVYVAHLARQLGRAGHHVDVFTRSDDPQLPRVCPLDRNVRVVHVPAGPQKPIAKERLLPHMYEFARRMATFCTGRSQRYDVVHANFLMSGIAALRLKRDLDLPFVVTFHALGKVRRLHQKEADQFPAERIGIERLLVRSADRIIARCFEEAREAAKALGVQLRLPPLDTKPVGQRAHGCDWPVRGAYLTYEGDALPCCMVSTADRFNMGNMLKEGVEAVWNGTAYRELREGLDNGDPPAICKSCAVYNRTF